MRRVVMWVSVGMVLAVAGLWVDSAWARREWDFTRAGYTYEIMSQAGHATIRVFGNEAEDEYMKEYRLAYWMAMVVAVGMGVGANTVVWVMRKRKEGPGFPVEMKREGRAS